MKRYIFFSTFVILLVSCEYKLEETNFREKEPPSEYAYIEINLNDISPLDTIYIWAPARFTCNLRAEQRTIHQTDIIIDGSSVSKEGTSQSYFSFIVYPERLDYGNHKLKVDCITSSGTRSLADLMGYEGYQFDVYWNIKVINISDYFTGGYRILKDGQLELFWDNPFIPDNASISYNVSCYDRRYEKLLQKSVITKDYVCGEKKFLITTYYRFDSKDYLYSGEIIVNTPIPKVYIEDSDYSHLRIYWDKPIAFAGAKYAVNYGENWAFPQISDFRDTTILVPKPIVGTKFVCRIDFHINIPGYSLPSTSSETSFIYGEKIGFNSSNRFFYNTTENVVYVVSGDSIAIVDPNSLNTRRIKSEIFAQNFISSPNSSKVAVIGFDKIYVYSDSKFLFPIIFHKQSSNTSYKLTDEFLFEFFEFSELDCNIYEFATASIINTYPPIGYHIEISADGQYFACKSKNDYNDIDVYIFNNAYFTKIATYTCPTGSGSYYDHYFNPNNATQIIIWSNYTHPKSEIYQLPQFEKLHSIDMLTQYSSRISNIDPITGLIVYETASIYTGILVTVITPLYNLENYLYTVPSHSYFLYNGCLFTSNGYAVDIKKELLQP